MKTIHLLFFLSATLTLASKTTHAPRNQKGFPLNTPKTKRGFLTCFQTYGGGSITCGAPDSHFCYDPTLGESCCLLDDGYCKAGDSCAPVAGFCCHDGEDPETCAARLDFAIPPTTSEVREGPLATKVLVANPSAAPTAAGTTTSSVTFALKGPKQTTSSSTPSASDSGAEESTTSTTSTSTITSTIHLAVATPEIGMTPEFMEPISNASEPSAKGDAAPSRGSLVDYQGAAEKGVRGLSVGGIVAVGVALLVGLCL